MLSSTIFVSQWCLNRVIPQAEGIRVLTYHGVSDAPNDPLSVSPGEFRKQMRYLATHGFRVISLDEYYECRRNGTAPTKESLILVFHDGYRDNFLHAFPVLREFGFTATVFLTTGFLGQSFEGKRMLSWPEVREMSECGITFGSHTVTHPFLTRVPPLEVEREVRESRRTIEEMLGSEVTSLCYPFGDFDDSTKRAVTDAGYHGACTIAPGANTPRSDLFALRSTEIGSEDTVFDFRKKLAGAYDPMHWLIQTLLKDRLPGVFYGPRALRDGRRQ